MIPESWLKERLETTDVQELSKRELTRLGLSESDLQALSAKGASPWWLEQWRVFISQMGAGDELWFFESPAETWNSLAGRAGYALVRSGRVVASLVSRKS